MTTIPRRRPGRPRKTAPVAEQTPVQESAQVVEQTPPVQEQSQIQWTVAKMTPHMLAGEIHRLYQEGEDLTPVHQVSDAIRAAQAPVVDAAPVEAVQDESETQTAPNVDESKVAELKAAVEAAKTSADKPRTFAVSYLNRRGALKVAHGVEHEDGEIVIHEARGFAAQYADDMDELHETAKKRHGNAYHVDYTD